MISSNRTEKALYTPPICDVVSLSPSSFTIVATSTTIGDWGNDGDDTFN